MTKRSIYGLLLSAALLSLPTVAGAQAMAELKPTGQWLVNSAGVQGLAQAGATQAPCIMANQYNNGFILRIAGGGGQILSLSVDFRQNAFTQGSSYPATISVDGGPAHPVTANAFSSGILIFGAGAAPDLYDQIRTGRSLAINVVGQTMVFGLDRSADGLNRLESCYNPQGTPQFAATPIATTPDTDVYIKRETNYPEFKQPSAQDVLKARAQAPVTSHQALTDLPPLSESEMADLNLTPADMAPYDGPGMRLAGAPPAAPAAIPTSAPAVPRVEAQALTPPTDIMPRTSYTPVQSAQWQAEAGEDIRNVLTRWAARDGRDLVWQADSDGGRIARDVAVNGTFEEAVAQVMADNAAALGLQSQFAQSQAMTDSGPASMNAQAGDNLRDVVQRWAAQNDVDLTWKAGEQYVLPAPVKGGDFAGAIEAALTQFDDMPVRPVGQLNRDPNTGRLSLIIETDKAS